MSSPTTDDAPARQLERLWPSPAVWVGSLVMAGFCGAVALPFGDNPTLVTLVVSWLLIAAALLSMASPVGIRGNEFVAGRAHVPLALVGAVTALDAAAMRRAHGPELDARAFLCLRGWVGSGLRLDLVDPQDPTPYWLVSARRPDRLVEAVERARRGE